ncbi:MAG: rhomboid family intramembrane serine protease [Streptosporangiales bacterium]|nr:rhomboid family intramembrane serine protease [Streptosporangiales bacterium]
MDAYRPATRSTRSVARHWSDRAAGGLLVMGLTLAVLWIVEIANAMLGNRLDVYGIHPHQVGWLEGILFAPFLHAGFEHLIANSLPLAVLGFLTYLAVAGARFLAVVSLTALTSGLGAFFLTPPGTVVVGASGVIFGLLGFLLVRGIVVRSLGSVAVSIGVLLLYGGVLTGMLPGQTFISWQGHLFGFLGGVLAAWLMRRRRGPGRAAAVVR